MSTSTNKRPGGDFGILQTEIVRGCDAPLVAGVPGDLLIYGGLNPNSLAVGDVIINNRSDDRNEPILHLAHGATVTGGETLEMYAGSLGTPNGVVTATQGALYVSNNPAAVYQNSDGAVAWTLISGGAGGESLAETLVIGNLTGGTDIVMSSGDNLTGVDSTTGNASGFSILGGSSTAAIGDGGSILAFSGSSTNNTSGSVRFESIASPNGSGSAQFGSGDTTSGTVGTTTLKAGQSSANNGGLVEILGGDTTSAALFSGGGVLVEAGGAPSGAQGGHGYFLAGDATAAVGLPALGTLLNQGGHLFMRAGASANLASGGNATLQAGAGGASGGVGGNVNLVPGAGGGAASDGVVEAFGLFQSSNILRGNGDPNVLGVTGTEGAIFQRTTGGSGELWLNTDGTTWVQLGAAELLSQSFAGLQWGSIQATGDLHSDGVAVDSFGFWKGIAETFGGGLGGRGTNEFGPRARFVVGPGALDSNFAMDTITVGELFRDHEFVASFKFSFSSSAPISNDFGGFVGVSTLQTTGMMVATPVGFYAGLQKVTGTNQFRLITRGAGGTNIPAGNFALATDIQYQLTIDMSVADTVVLTLRNAQNNGLVVTGTVTNTAQMPGLSDGMGPCFGIQSSGVDSAVWDFYSATAILNAAQFNGGSGGGSASTLEAVLAQGNVSGSNEIVLTDQNLIFGGVLTGETDSVSQGGAGGRLTIASGSTTNAALNGGAMAIFSGFPEANTVTGRSGDVFLGSGDIASVVGTAASGDLGIRSGNHAGLGASGTVLLTSGAANSGVSGAVTVNTGDSTSGASGALTLGTGTAPTAGGITIQPGQSSNGPGALVSIEAGEGVGAGGSAGSVLIAAGDPAVGFNFAGGSVSMTGSHAQGTGTGGGINLFGALGGTVSGDGGAITLTAGNAQAGVSNGGSINLTPGNGFGGGSAGQVTVAGDMTVSNDVTIGGKLNVAGLIDPTGLVLDEQAAQPFDPTGTTQALLWVRSDNPNVLVFTDNAGNSIDITGSGAGGSSGTGNVTDAFLMAGHGSMMPGSPGEGFPATYGIYGSSQVSGSAGSGTVAATVGALDGPVATLTSGAVPLSTSYLSTADRLITRQQRFKARFKFRATSASFADHRSFIGFTDTAASQLLTDDGLGLQYVGLINREASTDFEFVMRGTGGAIVPVTALVADNTIHILEIDSSDPTQLVLTLYDEDGTTVEATHTELDSNLMPDEATPVSPFVGVRSEGVGTNKTVDFHWHNVLTRADLMDTLGGLGGGSGASALNDLSDVVLTAPAVGEILIYDGVQWANAAFPGGGAASLSGTLALGNTTGGTNIQLTGGSQIETDNLPLELEVLDATAGSGAPGADIILNGGAGDSTAAVNGGGFQMLGGAAGTSGVGGGLQILLGSGGSAGGNGGSGTIQTGQGVAGNSQGGDFSVNALNGAGTGRGGIISLSAGAGGLGGGNGGNINLTPGAGSGGGTDGEVLISGDLNITGKLTVAGLIDPTGLVLTRQAATPYVPTAADGLLWIDLAGNLIYSNDSGDLDVSALSGGGGGGGETLSATLALGDQTGGQGIVLGSAASSAAGADILTSSDDTVLSITGGSNSTAGAFTPGSVPGSVVLTAGQGTASFQSPEVVLRTATAASGIEAGSIDLLAGAGGSIGLALPGGIGGAINITTGDGGAANGSGLGGSAGALTLTGGTGGLGAANIGGAGGALNLVGGQGGDATGADAPGAGGALTFTSGLGGTNGGGTVGVSGSMLFTIPTSTSTLGSFVFQAGAGSSPLAGEAGALLATAAQSGTREGGSISLLAGGNTVSGDVHLIAGAGGAGDEGGTVFISGADLDTPGVIGSFTAPDQGGDVEVRGGIGNGTGNGGGVRIFGGWSGVGGGTAGSVLVAGGDASTGSGGDGGNVEIFAGDGDGAGADGSIVLQDTIQFGNTSTEATAGFDASNSTMLKAGVTAVNTLGTRTSIVFPGDPMAATPTVINITLESSVGFVGVPAQYVIVAGFTSTTGFSVDFDSIPAAGVSIHWTARVVV